MIFDNAGDVIGYNGNPILLDANTQEGMFNCIVILMGSLLAYAISINHATFINNTVLINTHRIVRALHTIQGPLIYLR